MASDPTLSHLPCVSLLWLHLILLSFIDQLSFQEKHNHSKWVQQVYFLSSRSFHIARCLIILLRLHPPNFVFFCLVFLFYSSNSCDELVYKYNCGFFTETGGCNTMFANVNISLTVASHCSSSKAIRKLYSYLTAKSLWKASKIQTDNRALHSA